MEQIFAGRQSTSAAVMSATYQRCKNKQHVRLLIGFIWLKTGTSGVLGNETSCFIKGREFCV
jgi:hypothetical protein